MAQLEERLSELAELARPEKDSPFLSELRQIRFNAWHYADTDLWASLGDDDLPAARRGPSPVPTSARTASCMRSAKEAHASQPARSGAPPSGGGSHPTWSGAPRRGQGGKDLPILVRALARACRARFPGGHRQHGCRVHETRHRRRGRAGAECSPVRMGGRAEQVKVAADARTPGPAATLARAGLAISCVAVRRSRFVLLATQITVAGWSLLGIPGFVTGASQAVGPGHSPCASPPEGGRPDPPRRARPRRPGAATVRRRTPAGGGRGQRPKPSSPTSTEQLERLGNGGELSCRRSCSQRLSEYRRPVVGSTTNAAKTSALTLLDRRRDPRPTGRRRTDPPCAEGCRTWPMPENDIERIVLYIDDLDRCSPRPGRQRAAGRAPAARVPPFRRRPRGRHSMARGVTGVALRDVAGEAGRLPGEDHPGPVPAAADDEGRVRLDDGRAVAPARGSRDACATWRSAPGQRVRRHDRPQRDLDVRAGRSPRRAGRSPLPPRSSTWSPRSGTSYRAHARASACSTSTGCCVSRPSTATRSSPRATRTTER